MADNTSRGPKGTQARQATGIPVRLASANASPEEVAAVLAILATVNSDPGPDPTEPRSSSDWKYPQSQWSSPRGMIRRTPPHGPGGWRASALPR